MVGVAGTGVLPGIGGRLRRLVVRLVLGFGLAALVWLVTAIAHTATASAAESPTATSPTAASPSTGVSAGDGLLGNLVGSLTTTVTGTLDTVTGSNVGTTLDTVVGDVTSTATHVVSTTTSTVTSTVTGTVGAVTSTTHVATPVATAKPVAAKPVTRAVPPPAAPVRRSVAVVVHTAKTVAAPNVSPRRATGPAVGVRPHRPVAPPLPAPAPQQPSPAVPASSVTPGHSGAGQLRHAVAAVPAGTEHGVPAGAAGWSAEPAALAARVQALPTTSPD